MFDTRHYVPILKAKQGEFQALDETASPTKDMMTPLLEIVHVPWDYENEEEAKTIEQHLEGLGQRIAGCWDTDRPFFADSNLLDGDRNMSDGTTHHFTSIFNDFRTSGLAAIPVTGITKNTTYKDAVRSIIAQDQRGTCLRLQMDDFSSAALQATLDTDMTFYELQPANIDLVLDLGGIEASSLSLLTVTLPALINNAVPYINDWRSFTLASTSFPKNLGDIPGNTIGTIDRAEWSLWLNLLGASLLRFPSFADYSISHSEMVELDPRMMTVSANIRYTADDYWLIMRGRSTKKYGFGQYPTLCAQLVARPEYSGPTFSWGDQYIHDCANGTVGTGNSTTWRKVGNNHHFQKVVTQISNLA